MGVRESILELFWSHFGSFHLLELSLESNAFDIFGICALAAFGWDFRANSSDVWGPGPRKPPKTWWHHAFLNNSEHVFCSFGFSSLVWLFSLCFLLARRVLFCCSFFSVLLVLARSGLGSLLVFLVFLALLALALRARDARSDPTSNR